MSKLIHLTQGKLAIVDDEDYEYLNQWKWRISSSGYARRNSKSNNKLIEIRLHRVITNCPEDKQVDHINGNRLDNRKENLRICTHKQNSYNKSKKRTNKSGYKGVYWCTTSKKWRSRIACDGKEIHLGYFDDIKEAAIHYNNAALKYHGEFANL